MCSPLGDGLVGWSVLKRKCKERREAVSTRERDVWWRGEVVGAMRRWGRREFLGRAAGVGAFALVRRGWGSGFLASGVGEALEPWRRGLHKTFIILRQAEGTRC